MFVIIKNNCSITKYNLTNDLYLSFASFIFRKNKYFLELKDDYYFIDHTKAKQIIPNKYIISNSTFLYNIYIYVYENNFGINNFNLYNKCNFVIAHNKKANIYLNDNYLNNTYLVYKDGYLKSNYEILLNNRKYISSKIKQGDIVDYLGIRIIFFNDFLYINSFNIDIKLAHFNIKEISYINKEKKISTNYEISKYYDEYKIPKLDKFNIIKKPSFKDYFKSIIPSIIMSISAIVLSIFNNNSSISLLAPMAMVLSSVFFPIIVYVIELISYYKKTDNNINQYLLYLDNYYINVQNITKQYIDNINHHYFDVYKLDNIVYLTKDNPYFLNISIGKTTINKNFNYDETKINVIDNKIRDIKKYLSNINDYPIYVNILDNKIITTITKNNNKNYFFNKVLLEIISKHHYNDINIAIYSTDKTIFDRVYNVPHLFYKDVRLTLTDLKQLVKLDQSYIDRPLILFLYDKIDYEFKNNNIYVIYMSINIEDIYKNSNCIVEYKDKEGYLYKDKHIDFICYENNINFYYYFRKIARTFIKDNKKVLRLSDNLKDIEYNYEHCDYRLLSRFSTYNNDFYDFDLHESKHGPHGLIVGSTGYGKSELIVSMLLSLCLRYNPQYLNIVIIDYKGGGLVESLSYNNTPIDHIVASLDSLDDNNLDRLIIYLKNECKNRQLLFKKLSNKTNTSIMNIDDYLMNSSNLLSHLIIVVDEFAELKKEHPDKIKELISISRIGRSLGLHLILATQKPGGIIDEQIWSNSHFKIALKLFEESDSMDVIKSKEAAYLDKPGEFYLSYDNNLIKEESLYSKNDFYGNDAYEVSLLNLDLSKKTTYKNSYAKTISEASYICNEIIKQSKKYKVNKYAYTMPSFKNRLDISLNNSITFGIIDDYINSRTDILSYNLKSNILIFSKRIGEINAILNTYNENKIKCIVISNKQYFGKYISDSLLYENNDDILYLFNHLLSNLNEEVAIAIEDINNLLSYNTEYLDLIIKLLNRNNSFIQNFIIISKNINISYKLMYLFSNKLLINSDDQNDVSTIYGMKSIYAGKNYCFINEPITYVPILIEDYKKGDSLIKPIIKHIPSKISPNINDDGYLLGYDLCLREGIYKEDFIVLSYDETIINYYKSVYPNINAYLYSYNLKIKLNKPLLWIGQGIFNQSLFFSGLKYDLNYNEGLLIYGNNKRVIRCLDYE